MRVATWNVNGLRARLDFLLHWLRAREPDVVALQELKVEAGSFPRAELEAAGYRAVVHAQKSWNGVAVLAREAHRLESVCEGLPGQEELGARLVTARCEGIAFTSIYVPNGKHTGHDDFPRKLAWLDALRLHLEKECDPGAPLVLGGDFNIVPAPLDSWNEEALHGHIFHTDAERARFQKLLDWGLRDLFREAHPRTQAFSWWDYRGGAFHRGRGLRIDFLLATASAADAREVTIDRDYRKKKDGLTASDHAPVIAELAGLGTGAT